MTPGLETYFERELAFLADYREAFQKRYPAEAGRLMPDRTRVPDPHLERFIEGFASLAARIHHKLDDELPELTESLAGVLYPHLMRPIPSMAIAQFDIAPNDPPGPEGLTLPRHTGLRSYPVGSPSVACRFRTGYPVTLWPIHLIDAQVVRGPFVGAPPRTVAALRLHFGCIGKTSFSEFALKKLRFFLSGEKQVIATLYETLFLNCSKVVFRAIDTIKPALEFSPAEVFSQVGFDLDEGIVPMPIESFVGYRILMELLSFPSKFLFLDLAGWDAVAQAGFGSQVEVLCYLNRSSDNIEQGVQTRTFLMGCAPVVNLFSQSAEPLAIKQTRPDYRVVPHRINPAAVEVFSVDEVIGVEEGRQPTVFQPFYGFHLGQGRDTVKNFWHASRRAAIDERDHGTEVYLFVLDGDSNPRRPANLMLDVQTTCTNRDYPVRFLRGSDALKFDGPAPNYAIAVTLLNAPTSTLRPPRRRAAHWRVLSQLGLNHKTLTDPVTGVHFLQEIMRLCDFSERGGENLQATVNRQIIDGLKALRTRRALGRASSGGALGLCRGVEVTLEMDEKNYVGIGVYLVACVLERFLGRYTAINSFSQLVVQSVQGEFIKKWPPRAAEQQLL